MAGNSIEWIEGAISWPDDWDKDKQAQCKGFLEATYAAENLNFLQAAQAYQACFNKSGQCEDESKAKELFQNINNTYVNQGAAQQINISAGNVDQELDKNNMPKANAFDAAATEIAHVITNDLKQKSASFTEYQTKNSVNSSDAPPLSAESTVKASSGIPWKQIGAAIQSAAIAAFEGVKIAGSVIASVIVSTMAAPAELTQQKSESAETETHKKIQNLNPKESDTSKDLQNKKETLENLSRNLNKKALSGPGGFDPAAVADLKGYSQLIKQALDKVNTAIPLRQETERVKEAALAASGPPSVTPAAKKAAENKSDWKSGVVKKETTQPEPTSDRPKMGKHH